MFLDLILEAGKCFLHLREGKGQHFVFLGFGSDFLLQMMDFLSLKLILLSGFDKLFLKMFDIEPKLIDFLLPSI
jgi:hypothetical protein